MFEIPKQDLENMSEYKNLILKALKDKNIDITEDNFIDFLLQKIEPLSLWNLRKQIRKDYTLELNFNNSPKDIIKRFVESRISEEFVIFEDHEDFVFCIHEIDDFILDLTKGHK